MKFLVASPYPETLLRFFPDRTRFIPWTGRIDHETISKIQFDFLISFGHRFRIDNSVLQRLEHQALNLHMSLLPWNKGAHPNFWSWFDNTPKGASIHWITEGIDEGPIFVQKEMELDVELTLRTSYETLLNELCLLFGECLQHLLDGDLVKHEQLGSGSSHFLRDFDRFWPLLPQGWDTQCRFVHELGVKNRE